MPIQRIESLTYGVADMAAGIRFYEDTGLEKLDASASGATFVTPTRQYIHLRNMNDASLPRAPESGPTLREPVWGVDSPQTLDVIGTELSKDREVRVTGDGILHAHDEIGFAVAFSLSNPALAAPKEPRFNNYLTSRRINERVGNRPQLRPIRIGHIVYLIEPEGREKASAFYLDRLGFRLTDRATRVGDFMRVPGVADHHSILLMWHRQKSVRFDHMAFEVAGIDDVLATNAHMTACGWTAGMGPGRQSLGSHVYWHYLNPCGGEVEFFTDMDRFDDNWQPQIWNGFDNPGRAWVIGDAPGSSTSKFGVREQGGKQKSGPS